MKKLLILLILISCFAMPAYGAEITAPPAPDGAQELMPVEQESFAQDLWTVIKGGLRTLEPEIARCCKVCLALFAGVLLTSLVSSFPGSTRAVTELAGSIVASCLLIGSAGTLIQAASETVQQISDYGKLLLPAMTAAMAAQGGVTTSAALYTGTAIFDALLTALISSILVPIVYIFIALSVAKSALGDGVLKKLQEFVKWLAGWSLKLILYVFTGYITITGVVSGTTDQAALRATKLTISGMVPVVGGILSDASEAVLVSASVVKNSVGVYGLLAVIAIAMGPFLRIGLQYLLLKLTAAVCGIFASKQTAELINDFSQAMGLLLAMTGTTCLLMLISIVCFLKGVG